MGSSERLEFLLEDNFFTMTIYYHLDQLDRALTNPVLTIGNFDGVHRGHLSLFDLVKERSRAINGESVVMTFDPHPIRIMKPGSGPPLITPTRQKLGLIEEQKIDLILCLPFTMEFSAITAQDFVQEILVGRLGIKEVVVGYDYTFGQGRTGNTALLQEMGLSLGFRVHVFPPVAVNDTLVSSTRIRNLVQEGNLQEARKLLGRDYQICGTVVTGRGRGERLLGFPTANLELMDELIPRTGVYATRVLVDDQTFQGVTNIGYNPTFGKGPFSVETHILDFQQDLVGREIRVTFVERLRDERPFGSVQDLADQIGKDVALARRIFQEEGQIP